MNLPSSSFLQKQENLKTLFINCKTADERYKKIIELGASLPPFDAALKLPEYLVAGCQSELYLYTFLESGHLHFRAHSDALISKGLAALLLFIYQNETPETLLKYPPNILKDLGIPQTLSLSRSNGLASLLIRMRQDALKHYPSTI